MGEFLDYFKQKKNLANLLILGILILALPLAVQTVRQRQILKSRAVEDPVVFTGDNVSKKSDGTWIAKKPQISLLLTSPLGPAGKSDQINGPYGNHDTADNTTCTVSGWACDDDDDSQTIDVHIYADGLFGAGGTMIGAATANQYRSDLVSAGACGGTGNHGFSFSLPGSFKDGSSHPIYIYGINIGPTGGNSLLANTPKTITCTSTKTVQSENILMSFLKNGLVGTIYADNCNGDPCSDDVTYCDTGAKKTIHKHGGYCDTATDKCAYAFDVVGDCGGGGGNNCNGDPCSDDVTYCDTGAKKTIHKHGGYCDTATDKCAYAFDVVGDCGGGGGKCTSDPQCSSLGGRMCIQNETRDCVGACDPSNGVANADGCVRKCETVVPGDPLKCGGNNKQCLPGCCGSPCGSCRWDDNPHGFREVCDISNAACSSGTSCRSTTGCALDSDCGLPNNHCEDGQCKAGPPNKNCKVAGSLQARFNGGSGTLTVAPGTKVTAGIYRNGTGVPMGADVNGVKPVDTFSASISGPNGFSLGVNAATGTDFNPTIPGKYTLTGTCGINLTASATLTVSGSSTTACSLGNKSSNPDLGAACTACIASKKPGDVSYVKGQGHSDCSDQQIVNYLCNGGLSEENKAGCLAVANGDCASACGNTVTPTPTPTPPPVTTTKFRIAESKADLNSANWRNYTAAGMQIPFEFKDKTPGPKFIFVQFQDSTGKISSSDDCPNGCQAQIKLLGPDPTIQGCSLSFDANNTTVLNLTGTNFGKDKGGVKSSDNGQDLQIKKWKDDNVQAVWPTNVPENETLGIILTNTDDQSGEGKCSAVSQLSLGAKVFCRAPSDHKTDKVDLVLAGPLSDSSCKVTKQKVSIDKDGIIGDFNQKLEEGKQYRLSLKAPRGIRKNVPFTAGSGGTTNIPNFVLPIGDIQPADGGDDKINNLDKADLNRQYITSEDNCGRTADFNQDCRVNAIDWACMRYDFNETSDEEAKCDSSSAKQ